MTHSLHSHWRRGISSHGIALAAGVALATALTPSPTQPKSLAFRIPRPGPANEFNRALQTVMIRMDASMCITPSDDADCDFARAMIPHHQGAVEMAKLELLYGNDPRLRRLAQGMVVEQSQEIAVMQSILASRSTMLGTSVNP